MSLTRHKPLKRDKGLERTVGLAQTSPLRRSASTTSKPAKNTGPTPTVTNLVLARAAGHCERCGGPLDGLWGYSKQHRVPRALGGSSMPYINQASNLAVLCGTATTRCHGEVESDRTQAEADGWIVRHPKNPATQPVTLWDGRRVWLSDDGQYLAEPPAVAA